ncbi:MAG: ABC transporter ATP-binding protein/permease [Ignavibacteria bacterium]|nr:ABC transporter ATP-binding protein/permease [Ignavibacteria bacterium]
MKDLFPLLKYLKLYKKKLFYGFGFILFSIICQSFYPLIIGSAIDDISNNSFRYSLLAYIIIGLSLVVIGGIFLFLTRQTIIVVSREVENDLRNDFFSHLQYLPKSFFDKVSTGDIMARANNDINNVRNLLGPGIMYSVQTFFRTVIIFIILISINLKITIIAIIPLLLISLFVYKVMRITYRRSLLVQEAFSTMSAKAQENFSGIRVIKSYLREAFEINEFNRIAEDYQKKNLSLARIQSYSFPMMFLFTGLSVIVVIYFGGLGVINNTFTIGNIAEFIVYLNQLTWPMIALGWVTNLVQRAIPSMRRLTEIMNLKPIYDFKNLEIIQKPNFDIKGNIEFKNVYFKYPNTDNYVLKNINLVIPQGSSIGIIGFTGCGKTTLINLITALYKVTEGHILIDGINIENIPLIDLRRAIGIVPQESFLFSDTIGNNIAYSDSFVDENLLLRSAIIAGLLKDIESFPEKFHTKIGERGITLSGGQKQRTAIARAVYKNPKILILDDSLSSVDTETEKEILRNLKEFMENRTTIIVSHRTATIMNCDKIVVLDNGTIVEEGTHSELYQQRGIYYKFYIKQVIEQELKEI